MKYDKLISEIDKLIKKEEKKYGFPSFEEYQYINEIALELGKKLNGDLDVVNLSIRLMDLKVGEGFIEKKDHIKMVLDIANKLLDDFGVDKEVKEKVLHCIEAHHGAVPYKSLEAEICTNADAYRFINIHRIIKLIYEMGSMNKTFKESLDFAIFKLEEKHNILSLDICKKELEPVYFKIKEFLEQAKDF